MPGYAYPVGASAEQGTFKSISFTVNESTSLVPFYTPTTKTKVVSVLATNTYGTILPVSLYIKRDSDDVSYLTSETRVLKHKYMVQQLVSGDLRVDDKGDQQVDRYKVINEFVLNAGDSLIATCPVEDAVVLTVTAKEEIQ